MRLATWSNQLLHWTLSNIKRKEKINSELNQKRKRNMSGENILVPLLISILNMLPNQHTESNVHIFAKD
jgi:hypothetical protein